MKKVLLILFIIICTINTYSIAMSEEIIESQKKALDIPNFIKEADRYTKDTFEGFDTETLLRGSFKGEY